jgi:cytochrome P450
MILFDPQDNDWLKNKFHYYQQLRQQKNLYFSEKYKMFVLIKYDDVFYALSNPNLFSSSKGNLIVEDSKRFGKTLGASDNPNHDIMKNIVIDAYSKSNLERISNFYKNKLLEFLTGSTINLTEVVHRTTSYAICELINLPYDKENISNLIYKIQTESNKCINDGTDTSYNEFRDIVTYCLSKKIPSSESGIYHSYLNNNPKNFPALSLFTGPTISGASSLSGAIQFLILDLYRENQIQSLITDKNLIPDSINESLRFNTSTGRFSRTVTQDILISNTNLKPGDRVALCLDSANRDPHRFSEPDKFKINRDDGRHLGFGYGLHACIALTIAKTLMKVFLESILDNFGSYEIINTNDDLNYLITSSGNNDLITNLVMKKI